jgi:FkbM family methyltransferase
MIKKFTEHRRRVLNSFRFKVPFLRRSTFRVPSEVVIGTKSVPLFAPDEVGAKCDFLTCFIDDEYGLAQVSHPIKTIVDVGSNVGFYSMAARSYFPEARIHAYEPNPRALRFCRKNLDSLNAMVYGEALGSWEGEVFIRDCSDSNQVRTSGQAESADASAVPQVTLATVIERLETGCIDLMKVDCEGAEWDLFSDPDPWSKIRLLRMEYHLWGIRKYEDLVTALNKLNFKITLHRPAGEWGTVWAENLSTSL